MPLGCHHAGALAGLVAVVLSGCGGGGDPGASEPGAEVSVWLTQVDSSHRGAIGLPLQRKEDLAFETGAMRAAFRTQGKAATPQPSAAGSDLGGTLECRKDEAGRVTKDCKVVPPVMSASDEPIDPVTVTIDPAENLQEMYGFGAAMTHSSAQVLLQLKQSNPALYNEVMDRLFGSSHAESAGITAVRFPIGSSDFARREETFSDVPAVEGCTAGAQRSPQEGACDARCSMPGNACSSVVQSGPQAGQAGACEAAGCGANCENCTECAGCCCVPADWELEHFGPLSLENGTHEILEVLIDAKAINPDLWLMGSPWSPPAWLKVDGILDAIRPENTLIDDDLAYTTYAKYLAKVCLLFQEAGLPLTYLTLQNEPLFGWAQYPGMYFTASQYVRLGQAVKSHFAQEGLAAVKILTYDHNWDVPEYPFESLYHGDSVFDGTAWHCYGGDMASAMESIGGAFPGKEQHFTECTGSFEGSVCDINNGMVRFGDHHNWDMTNTLLGSVAKGASSGIKWIMVLDENCGPYLSKVEFQWGRPLVSIPGTASSMSDIKFNQDFWTVATMARFIRPGAHRVASQMQSGDNPPAIIEAFRDDAAQTMTLIAVNLDHNRELPLTVVVGDQHLTYTLTAWSTANLVWTHGSSSFSAAFV